jgi:hypothetical protein
VFKKHQLYHSKHHRWCKKNTISGGKKHHLWRKNTSSGHQNTIPGGKAPYMV